MANYILLKDDNNRNNRISCNDLILQSIGEGVCVVDKENKISFANASALKMLGWDPEELLAQHYEPVLFGREIRTDHNAIESIICPVQFALIEGEKTHVNSENFYRRDKSVFLVEYVCVPLWENDEIVGVVITFQNITERRDLEDAVAKARDAALESAQEKANFLANMSHEIRTPLNGIIGITELLSETNLSIGQKDYLETLKTSASLLLNIVNDILDFSKIEAGKLELEETNFDLREVVSKTIKLFVPQAFKKQIKLEFKIDGAAETNLCGDAGRLRQVLHNLISNAIKFTEEGQVSLNVSVKKENLLLFEISDTGIGIEADKQTKIFEPFAQADISTTRQFGGTGLGLAISRQIVQMMNGQIGVESEYGKGSKFWFTAQFSYPPTSSVTCAESRKDALTEGFDAKVLVVEDNPVNQQVALGRLRQFGITADVAENGLKAVEAVREKKYDLVLMDCRMPVMDGFEATREIRRLDNEAKDVKIIAMTASVKADERQKCFDAGMNDYLAKPITIEDLRESLAKHLTHAAPANQPQATPEDVQLLLAEIIEPKILKNFIEIEKRGEKDFAIEMLNLYLKHSETQIAEMKNAVSERNADLVKNKSHILRGSSANIGLRDLLAEFTHLEELIEVDWTEADIVMDRILKKFTELKIKVSHLTEIGELKNES